MNAKTDSNNQQLSLHEIKHIFSGGFLRKNNTEDDIVLSVNKLVQKMERSSWPNNRGGTYIIDIKNKHI